MEPKLATESNFTLKDYFYHVESKFEEKNLIWTSHSKVRNFQFSMGQI